MACNYHAIKMSPDDRKTWKETKRTSHLDLVTKRSSPKFQQELEDIVKRMNNHYGNLGGAKIKSMNHQTTTEFHKHEVGVFVHLLNEQREKHEYLETWLDNDNL